MKTFFIYLSFICFLSLAYGQGNTQNVIQVTDHIYMIQDKGGNIGVSIGEDGVFMIDDQFATNIEATQQTLESLQNEPVQFLINTHHHGDHTGGNLAMAQTGAIIVSQQNVRSRLLTMLQEKQKLEDKALLPMVTFSEEVFFHFNEEQIHVFHVHNAHTDGDAMVYFMESNVLHTGDVFFKDRYPYIDLSNGGSVQGYINALSSVLMLVDEETKIIPGHGDLASIDDIKYTHSMLTDLHKKVNKLLLENKTEAEIVGMTNLTKQYDEDGYGSGFISTERMLKTIYDSITKR